MDEKQGLPIIPFASAREWEAWLEEHAPTARGVWLKLAKKATGVDTVTYAEALDAALCHGWIDGQKGAFDEVFWLQRFTPRGPRSKWSRINRERALELIDENRMLAAGLRAVDEARHDGRWERAYEPQSTATVPDDLRLELDRNPEAAASFAALNSANRYAILYRIQDAKKPETRARRIEGLVAMLAKGERLYP